MAARRPAGDAAENREQSAAAATPMAGNPAVVRTQEYDAGVGWEVGQKAPQDAFRALADDGSGAVTGPVVNTHPGGYARQIAVKGQVVTAGVRRELDAAEAEESAAEGEQG